MIPYTDDRGLRSYRSHIAGTRALVASCPRWLVPVAFLLGLAIGVLV
jgi:hypothetical protein